MLKSEGSDLGPAAQHLLPAGHGLLEQGHNRTSGKPGLFMERDVTRARRAFKKIDGYMLWIAQVTSLSSPCSSSSKSCIETGGVVPSLCKTQRCKLLAYPQCAYACTSLLISHSTSS